MQLVQDFPLPVLSQLIICLPGIEFQLFTRVRLCLEENKSACGPYLEGHTVEELAELAQPWLIALVVVVTLLGLVAVLIAIKCVCTARRQGAGKAGGMRGTKMLGRHATMEGYKSSQVFAIAGENQHGIASSYDMNQQAEHGSSNSHTDSANSQVGESENNLLINWTLSLSETVVGFLQIDILSFSGTIVGLPEKLQ